MTAPQPRPESPAAPPATAPEYAIEARSLTKIYRGSGSLPPKEALKQVDLAIPKGSLFGLLGPNGAGKSTFINILAGLVNKTGGTATVCGIDIDREPRQVRASIGVVPQELNLDTFFTAREILDLQAGLYGVRRAARRTEELLITVGLADMADSYARMLSGGMRRRLMVAKAMVHSPPVLVLDEPTAGVDVELRRHLWDHIRELNARGTTILLTTHYLEEAEQLCDQIAIINHGQVIANDTTAALVGRLDRKELTVSLSADLMALPHELDPYDVELQGPRRLVFRYRPSRTRVRDILAAMRSANVPIADLTTHEADLEDIFLELTRAPKEDQGR